ncbi:PXA domain-containing protein [Dipodascopsis uninucleata]
MSNPRGTGSSMPTGQAAGHTKSSSIAGLSRSQSSTSNGINKLRRQKQTGFAESRYDPTTINLIKNTLIPTSSIHKPLEESLPALTSFPDIDVELYCFIALIIRQFVQSWYNKITGDDIDRTFVYEVVQILAHVTRSLEERLRKVDLELLLLDDIPFVLDTHLRDYRLARQKVGTAYAAGRSFEEIFHALQPHPALRLSQVKLAEQGITEEDVERKYLSVLSKGILAVLLPSEDLGSATERTLLRSLLADVVLWKVIDKLSEPFMLHEIISKVIEKSIANDGQGQMKDFDINKSDPQNEAILKEPNEKQNMDFCPQIQTPSPKIKAFEQSHKKVIVSLRSFIVSLISFLSLLQSGIAFIISFSKSSSASSWSDAPSSESQNGIHSMPSHPHRTGLLTIALFPTMARLINLPARQPWLMSTIELLALPLVSLPPGSLIDRLLSHFFHKYLMTSNFFCSVLAISRQTLFPGNGRMAEPRVYPSDEEKLEILKRVHGNILRIVPIKMRRQVLGDNALQGVEDLLSPFENKFANKHLLYFLCDMIIVKVLPELAIKTPEELRVWRLGEDEKA